MSHVLIIASRRFNDAELWPTLDTLIKRDHTFEVVSTDLVLTSEGSGKQVRVKRLWSQVNGMKEFRGLMFVSGNHRDTAFYWDDAKANSLVVEAIKLNLPIAAICAAVPSVGIAAHGKKVSCFPLQSVVDELTKDGASIQSVAVTVDGNLVTAEFQAATQIWAEAFCDVLETGKSDLHLQESHMMPGRRERRPIPELEAIKEIVKRTGKKGLKDDPK